METIKDKLIFWFTSAIKSFILGYIGVVAMAVIFMMVEGFFESILNINVTDNSSTKLLVENLTTISLYSAIGCAIVGPAGFFYDYKKSKEEILNDENIDG